MTSPYEEHTERHWFVKGTVRGDIRRVEDEIDAHFAKSLDPDTRVVLFQDVHYGPLVEADR